MRRLVPNRRAGGHRPSRASNAARSPSKRASGTTLPHHQPHQPTATRPPARPPPSLTRPPATAKPLLLQLFLFGWLFFPAWWTGALLPLCTPRDPRESIGWGLNIGMTVLTTIVIVWLCAYGGTTRFYYV